MSNNTTLPGTGEVVEDIDIGSGVKRQVVTIGDRAGNAVDVIGGLTESAPASDTGSSGLNGRLQRLAQNITSLIGKLPAALTGSGNLKVALLETSLSPATSAVPVLAAQPSAATGTFTNATQTTNVSGSSLAGYETVTVSINGTYGTATGVFEASDDGGTTWYGVQGARSDSNTIESGYTALTNTSRMWVSPIAGANAFRVRSTAVASGTVNVRLTVTGVATADSAVVAVGAALPAGSNTIGNVGIPTGQYNKCFAAAFTTLTRPANTTAYTAGDSISNNATAASVTALSATVSDVNDDPVFLADILINATDTGLQGKKLRANVFNADPTASTGVGAGDNAAYSQKKNGYIGTFVGTLETGFSDGCVGRLVPSFRDTNYTPAGGFIVTKPTSGAMTLYIQFIAEEAFTPSANSTTIIATVRGWQARAA